MIIFCPQCEKPVGQAHPADAESVLAQHIAQVHSSPPVPPPPAFGGRWREQLPQFQRFEEAGDSVEGILADLDTITIGSDPVNRAHVETAEGRVSFLLTTHLDSLLAGVPLGSRIRIQYEGEAKSVKGKKYKLFRVWVAEAL